MGLCGYIGRFTDFAHSLTLEHADVAMAQPKRPDSLLPESTWLDHYLAFREHQNLLASG